MTDPKTADKILKILCNSLEALQPVDIAEAANEDSFYVDDLLPQIADEKPGWLRHQQIIGSSAYWQIPNSAKAIVKQFLKEGGFENKSKQVEEDRIFDEEKKRLEMEHLTVTITQAKQAISDSKFAKQMAWASLGVAVVALLISIFK
jgi:hypothetical protein